MCSIQRYPLYSVHKWRIKRFGLIWPTETLAFTCNCFQKRYGFSWVVIHAAAVSQVGFIMPSLSSWESFTIQQYASKPSHFRPIAIESLNRQRLLRLQIRIQDPAAFIMQDLQSGHRCIRQSASSIAMPWCRNPIQKRRWFSNMPPHDIRLTAIYSLKTKYALLNIKTSFSTCFPEWQQVATPKRGSYTY